MEKLPPRQQTDGRKKNREVNRRDFLKLAARVTAGVALVSTPIILSLLCEKKEENEPLRKALPEIQKALNDFYAENTPSPLEEAFKNTGKILKKILGILENNGIAVKRRENEQIRLIQFFQENRYMFAISPMAISNDRYLINAPLYRIGETESFDLSQLQFEGLPASNEKVDINMVEETLVPDIRETVYALEKKQVLDGMTVINPYNQESIVLIFPDKMRTVAHKEGLNFDDYRRTVEINELSQVYFSKLIPNELLGVSLAKLGIDTRGNPWRFYHVQEAFSDFASLKYGKTFKFELTRILINTSYSYDFSRAIALAALELGLEDVRQPTKLTDENVEQIIYNLDGDALERVKDTVIGSYEANIALVFSKLFDVIQRSE